MTVLTFLCFLFLPLGDLGSREYTNREAATRVVRGVGWLAYPGLVRVQQEGNPEAAERATVLLSRLPLPAPRLARLALPNANRLPDAALVPLGEQLFRLMHEDHLLPERMTWAWASQCYEGTDGSIEYTCYNLRHALSEAATTRILQCFAFWYPIILNPAPSEFPPGSR